MKPRVIFILKRREDYNAITHSHIGLSTGLYNSANFMNEMLNSMHIESKLVVVPDNNHIDREVTKHKPTHVIIEALWVVPQKFNILKKLHPKVKWIIRLHSEMPFMAGEGMAMDWIGDYSEIDNVILGINAPRMYHEVKNYLKYGQFGDSVKDNQNWYSLRNGRFGKEVESFEAKGSPIVQQYFEVLVYKIMHIFNKNVINKIKLYFNI